MNHSDENISPEERPKSKSQIKRELLALQNLGKDLIELSAKQLKKIPMSEKLQKEILAAKNFSRGAYKRQLQYIGRLIKHENVELITKAHNELLRPLIMARQKLHLLEIWRDQLLENNHDLLNELIERFSISIERQHLRTLIRNTQKERKDNKPPKSYRLLFQYLSDAYTRETNSGANNSE